MPSGARTAAIAAAIVTLGACSSSREAAEGATPPVVLTYTATDYAFTGPAEIPSGAVTFRLVNQGREMHHAVLARLDSGRTLGDVIQFYSEKADPLLREHPGFLTYQGGPGTGVPGEALEAIAVLDPGDYILICYIPSPDGQMHFQKGMTTSLRVIPAESPAPPPAASVQLVLRDYEFSLSRPLTAGTHTVRVTNDGPQVHDVELVRLNDGVSANQFLQAIGPESTTPPPGQLVTGVGGVSPGQVAYWTVTLAPGSYAIVCLVPDRTDGAPHFAHGMVQEFEVS